MQLKFLYFRPLRLQTNLSITQIISHPSPWDMQMQQVPDPERNSVWKLSSRLRKIVLLTNTKFKKKIYKYIYRKLFNTLSILFEYFIGN